MKMADGGYRPAYNVQLTADTASHANVGIGVTNEASDMAATEDGDSGSRVLWAVLACNLLKLVANP